MTYIEILEWMIEEYDKRGGGYSQKEALKEAIRCMGIVNKTEKKMTLENLKTIISEECQIAFFHEDTFNECVNNVYDSIDRGEVFEELRKWFNPNVSYNIYEIIRNELD